MCVQVCVFSYLNIPLPLNPLPSDLSGWVTGRVNELAFCLLSVLAHTNKTHRGKSDLETYSEMFYPINSHCSLQQVWIRFNNTTKPSMLISHTHTLERAHNSCLYSVNIRQSLFASARFHASVPLSIYLFVGIHERTCFYRRHFWYKRPNIFTVLYCLRVVSH